MTREETDTDLREAIERRLAERLAAARRRREQRAAYLTAKNTRRAAGLRQRHAAKLNRRESQ